MMRASPLRFASLVSLLLLARVATADPQLADKAAAAAQQLYADGHFLDAAAQFKLAYAQDPKPAYLFNIAQAYRFGKACASAAEYYRKFVDAVHDAPNLDKVRRYIADMDSCAAARTGTLSRSPSATASPSASESSPGSAASSALPPATDTDDDPGRTRRYTGIAIGVVGIAAVVLGVHYQQVVNQTENQQNTLNDQCSSLPPANVSCTGSAFATLEDKGHQASVLAITSYSVGAAAIAGGFALYFLGRSAPAASERTLTLAPTRGGAMLGAAFRF